MSTSNAGPLEAPSPGDQARVPVFVVGPLRAGTTLLRLILAGHPSLYMFGEFEEAVEPLDAPGWPTVEAYRQYLDVQRAFLAKKLQVSPSAQTYQELALDLWRQLCDRSNKPFVGGSIHSHFERCPDLWPDARYIHLVRDPRDVARSCIGMGWVGNSYYGADYWISAEERWDELVRRTKPEQRHELRYEDLVVRPAEVLTGICRFLGLEFDSAMLDYPKRSSYGPPEPNLIEQWRVKATPREVAFLEHRCGDLLAQRGYVPSGTAREPGPHERLGLWLDHRARRVSHSIRLFGPKLWLESRVANLVPGSSFHKQVRLRMNAIVASRLK